MSDFTLEAAMERARRAAMVGAAADFDAELQGIQTLDRDGSAPMRELRMLELVARARQADLAGVDRILASLEPLAPSDWHRVHGWLIGAPEMAHAAYAEFVRGLDRRQRRRVRVPAMRRITPVLAIALVASAISLLLLAWRLSPLPPEETNLLAIGSVLEARIDALEGAMPAEWASEARAAARALGAHASADAPAKATEAVDRLTKALRDAASSPAAGSLARQLVGPMGSADDLKRLAEGVQAWRGSPWLSIAAWSDGTATAWHPQGDALFAWQVLLRHAPLAAWLPGWFGADFRVDPLQPAAVRVRTVAQEDRSRTLQVQAGSVGWPLPAVRIGRHWTPRTMVDRWSRWQPSLAPDRCDTATAQLVEARMRDGVDAVAAWVQVRSSGQDMPAPDASALPWWVP